MKKSRHWKKGTKIKWFFVFVTLLLYGLVYVKAPDRAYSSLRTSLRVLLQIVFPIFIAFVVKFFINLYLSPADMQKMLAKNRGIRGLVFSSFAGVLSMGPVFAWYPLLKDFREKGVPDFYLANFLTSRAVKPFLFPVMVYYFGWVFSIVLNMMILVSSPLVAVLTSAFSERN